MIEEADILAAIDVIRQATQEADDSDFERAVALRNAIRSLVSESRTAIGMLEAEMLRQVEESPRQFGGVNFMAVRDYRESFRHDEIEGGVVGAAISAATDRATGEIDPKEAARQAAYMMRRLYVSPSTTAKKTELDRLGLERKEVVEREYRGRRLHEVDGG